MRLKQISLLTLFVGVLFSVVGVIAPFIALQNYTSQIGADTPTYHYIVFRLMNGWPFCMIVFGITLIVSALFCLIFSKTVKNNCNIITTALSLGLSAVGAMGLVCAFLWFTIASFHEMSKHPITYPVSISLGLFCFFLFVFLIAVYLKLRKNTWSIKGFCIDILTSVIYLPTFFHAFSYLYEIVS